MSDQSKAQSAISKSCLFFLLIFTTFLLTWASPAFSADKFPDKPIQIVTHASPGGGTDTTVRTLIPALKEHLGVPVNVTMKIGGAGRVAMNYVKGQPADGYTVMLVTSTHLYSMAQGGTPLGIDDITGLVRASNDPLLIVAKPDGRFSDIESLLANKNEPARWGTTHIGTVDHASAESFAEMANIKINVVPFEGGGAVVTNLMGGNIDVASMNLTEASDMILRGDLKALAIMAEERATLLPDVPTLKEKGFDTEFSTIRGIVVLNEVPKEKRDILEKAFLAAMQETRYQELLKNTGMPLNSPAPADIWDARMHKVYQDAKKVLTKIGMTSN